MRRLVKIGDLNRIEQYDTVRIEPYSSTVSSCMMISSSHSSFLLRPIYSRRHFEILPWPVLNNDLFLRKQMKMNDFCELL